jgi:hypothetical protein
LRPLAISIQLMHLNARSPAFRLERVALATTVAHSCCRGTAETLRRPSTSGRAKNSFFFASTRDFNPIHAPERAFPGSSTRANRARDDGSTILLLRHRACAATPERLWPKQKSVTFYRLLVNSSRFKRRNVRFTAFSPGGIALAMPAATTAATPENVLPGQKSITLRRALVIARPLRHLPARVAAPRPRRLALAATLATYYCCERTETPPRANMSRRSETNETASSPRADIPRPPRSLHRPPRDLSRA